MKNNLFDEHVKKQFDGYRPEVAPHIWEKIAAAQQRKKPAPFWVSLFANKWIAAALIVAAATGAGIYISQHTRTKENVAAADQKNIQPAKKSTKNNNTISKNNVLPSADDGLQQPVVTPPANDDAQKNNEAAINNNSIAQQEDNEVFQNSPVNKRNTTQYIGNKIYTATTQGTAINDDNQNDSENFNNTSLSSIRSLQSLKEKVLLHDLKYQSGLAKLSIKRNPAGAIPCPPAEKDAAGNKSYAELYAGPDYVFRSFSDAENAAYMEQRKATVSAGFSYSAGVRYTKVFKNGFSFRTGLNYSMINEQFKYVKGNVTHNIYITNTAGDTTGTYVERGTQYQQSTNKYRSFDIPVTAGYELGNGRLHANVNAGVMINISSKQKGFVLDPAGTPVDISSGKSNSPYSYKTNAGVSFLGAVSVYYKLNDRFHLLAEPYLRYGLSSMTQEAISLKQKNHTAGIRLGLRMDL